MADGDDKKSETTGTSGRQKRALERVAMSTTTLLVVGIVLMLNYLAYRHYERIDWTSEGMFTLSPKSLSVLHGLNKDVNVYLFMSRGEPNFDKTEELLRRYEAATSRFKVHYVDPYREPDEFKLLAQRFGVLRGVTETGEEVADVAAIVAIGDKNWHVNREDLVGWDMGPAEGGEPQEQLSAKAEQALTGAIVQVISGRATKICVTKGHDEWSLDESAKRSIAAFKFQLRHDNIEWMPLDTLGAKSVPKECDAVYVLGPTRAFSAAEAKLVLDYVQAGGNALLLLDPVLDRDQIQPTGFEEPLKSVGVRLDNSLVAELDEKHLVSPNPLQFTVSEYGDHETTRPFRGQSPVVVGFARSLSAVQPSDRIEPLLRTSPLAFGITDPARVSRSVAEGAELARGAGDLPGPLDLALAVQTTTAPDELHKKPGGRLIVVGDSDILIPELLAAAEFNNYYLASVWTGWLTQREALIQIPPKKVKGGEVVFTQDGLRGLFFRVAVLLPGAALLFGLAVWFNRRS